jgi:flagellar FliL protein
MKIQLEHFALFVLLIFGTFTQILAGEEDGEDGSEPVVVQYHNLSPAFVTNFGAGSGTKLKFLKADISVRVTSTDAINEVMNHDALVRHEIVLLLSRQTEESLSTSTGQEEVRLEALAAVKAALKDETGGSQIDDLLFTSFVVQR